MSPFATREDVEARWRPLTPDEQRVASTLLDDASDMIRVRWPDTDARVTAGSLSAASLRRVVANMVKRAMMVGPLEGVDTQSQNAGPFGVSIKPSNPNANLYLSAEDVKLLDGRRGRRAFSVDLSSGTLPDFYDS